MRRNGALATFTHRGPEEVQNLLVSMPDGEAKQALVTALDQYGTEGVYDFGAMPKPEQNPGLVAACNTVDRLLAQSSSGLRAA